MLLIPSLGDLLLNALRRFPSVLDPHIDLLNVGVDELKGNSLLCIQRQDGVLVEVLENLIGERNGHVVINPLQRTNLQLPGVLQGQTVELDLQLAQLFEQAAPNAAPVDNIAGQAAELS
jgi:hypothetical protein